MLFSFFICPLYSIFFSFSVCFFSIHPKRTNAGFSLANRKGVRTSVKYMAIYRNKEKYDISQMCNFFKVSRSRYYDYVYRMQIPAKDLHLAEKIKECQDKCGKTYSYRRVHICLKRNRIYHNSKTILRVIQKYNLLSVVRRKKYRHFVEIYIVIQIV